MNSKMKVILKKQPKFKITLKKPNPSRPKNFRRVA